MVKRTKKTFTDYNQYRDRPFGLKWATAYAMDDLMKGVLENEAWATKEVVGLELMNRKEIDTMLLNILMTRLMMMILLYEAIQMKYQKN